MNSKKHVLGVRKAKMALTTARLKYVINDTETDRKIKTHSST